MPDNKPDSLVDNNFTRPIRSFVKREGKLTGGQKNALEQLWPTHGVDLGDQRLDLTELFGRSAPVVLEIGFGNGLSLADMAEAHADMDFFGIEVHRPGVGSCLVQAKKRGLNNIRVSVDDAVLVLNQQIADGSLERVQIFFPDPWHKKRHHKRRLIQPVFVEQLVAKLKPGGKIHVATDWQNYAEYVLAVLSTNENLKNAVADAPLAANFLSPECSVLTDSTLWANGSLTIEESGTIEGTAPVDNPLLTQGCSEKPSYRPDTKYENRGIRLGHGVWDLIFVKEK
ncbi:MAG: tRNA (guanosine(46)-N7)-methyltransferase TrmB [Arenicella sp.]|nr:tRNA (guanosine(46)-N7)-methyltransferase TrmB [Arenicella sp.]